MHTFDLEDLGTIAVICGGDSSERSVSLKSGDTVTKELSHLGIPTQKLIIQHFSEVQRSLQGFRSAIIALHGGWGEDGSIQAFLQMTGVRYSGSRPLPSAIAMNKAFAKKVFKADGIPTPDWVILNTPNDVVVAREMLGLPFVIKPISEGSSFGVSLVTTDEEAAEYAQQLSSLPALAETFVNGKILTVPIIDTPHRQDVLAPIEICPTASKLYDREAKSEGLRTIIPHPNVDIELVKEIALKAHHSIGCSGVTRVDIIYEEHKPIVLEINTVPGMGSRGNLLTACKANGISNTELVLEMVHSIC